jgi:hypothetical protein
MKYTIVYKGPLAKNYRYPTKFSTMGFITDFCIEDKNDSTIFWLKGLKAARIQYIKNMTFCIKHQVKKFDMKIFSI